MPLNLIKTYNNLLELQSLPERTRKTSLLAVFNQDIATNSNFRFRHKQVTPTPKDGEISMDTLFTHLTTVMVCKVSRAREYDPARSSRLHWIKFHLEERKQDNMLIFSVDEPEGVRTYIYDIDEKYVVVLEPLRQMDAYFLLTAYYVSGKDAKRDKFGSKYKKRRLDKIH
jgi:hypothetical protein